ncbi:hypothetical protein HQ945_02475 [Phyllobacterium sp. BT25]|uniref:Uncharacterized protein n=1 Tax=Phyllobacterium pellucidum TaxID=2740464 RepID=A0A849VJS5_9HYPH|nr:hypothetical protein [Phyllobacterium pellucidum]NTS30108.1 hypothetical protein [Phyllobacterium pellucidum]
MFISDLQSKLKMGLGIPIWLKDNLSPSPKSKKKCDERPSSRLTILASAGVSTMKVSPEGFHSVYARSLLHKCHEIAAHPPISLPLLNRGNWFFNEILPLNAGIGTLPGLRIAHEPVVFLAFLDSNRQSARSFRNGDLT